MKDQLESQAAQLEGDLQVKTKAVQELTHKFSDSKSLIEQQEGMLNLRNEVAICSLSSSLFHSKLFPLFFPRN